MRRKNNDLWCVLLIVSANLLVLILPDAFMIVRLVFALPLVFFLPGYLMVDVLTQKRLADTVRLLLLSCGLSIAIDISGGLLLNMVPAGLSIITWNFFLSVLTVVLLLLCLFKRNRQHIPVNHPRELQKRIYLAWYNICILCFTGFIVIYAFMYATGSIAASPTPGFTQFWVQSDNYPAHLCTVVLEISSHEPVTTEYQVVVTENDRIVAQWSAISLEPLQMWQQDVSVVSNSATKKQVQLHADLYRTQDVQHVYRSVQMTLATSQSICSAETDVYHLKMV